MEQLEKFCAFQHVVNEIICWVVVHSWMLQLASSVSIQGQYYRNWPCYQNTRGLKTLCLIHADVELVDLRRIKFRNGRRTYCLCVL